MKIKAYFIFTLLFVAIKLALPQSSGRFKELTIRLNTDTVKIDSLSLIYNSLVIRDSAGNSIDTSFYKTDYSRAIIIPGEALKKSGSEYIISYQTFPYSLPITLYHKLPLKTKIPVDNLYETYRFGYDNNEQSFFKSRDLVKHGTLARGIGFGNNQDVVLNSTLNLQLAGKLSDDIDILAAISDENIPVQPDGNSQSINEFDKVFVQLDHKNFRIIAGDYEITRPESYFMNLNKKTKGLMVWVFNKNQEKKSEIVTRSGFSVQKGKYNRMIFNGIEAKQGPYKLRGANNETFIVVLAGSEKVYIDGTLLQRGLENDYVIDYNLAEISFTPRQAITKDSRIIVEFEYTERFYNRFMVVGSAVYKRENATHYVHFYSESDARNQPIDQELDASQIKILENAGDNIQMAISSTIKFDTAFTGNYVFYQLKDTILTDGSFFDSILVYSTHPDSARWRATFSYTGENKGFYIIDTKAVANGRVYKWVAPVDGKPAGNYMPVSMLVTPKKKQMIVAGGKLALTQSTIMTYETAVSNNDLNTYSGLNDNDNTGIALNTGLEHTGFFGQKSEYKLFVNYQLIQKYFTYIEPYRETEFDRDWNRQQIINTTNQHMLRLKATLKTPVLKNNEITSEFLRQKPYQAYRNQFSGEIADTRNQFLYKASILYSDNNNISTRFIRGKSSYSRKLGIFTLTLFSETEDNIWHLTNTDSLMPASQRFYSYGASASTTDSAFIKSNITYQHRIDYIPNDKSFKTYSDADQFSFITSAVKNPKHYATATISFRKVNLRDTIPGSKNVNTLLGQIDHYLSFLKGIATLNTYYETGTSLEPKREFTYIQVNPGQGAYIWNDYNHNGIKELNEFETASFADTASYIRVMLPGENQIKTYNLVVGEIVNLKSPNEWNKQKGIKKIISRFSDQFAWRMERKITNNDYIQILNPFFQLQDNELITYNGSLRNTIWFNRNETVFSADATMQANRSKIMLLSGFDERKALTAIVRFRWNITQWISLLGETETGEKQYLSEAFSAKNNHINHYICNPSVQFIVSPEIKIKADYRYQQKINLAGNEKLYLQGGGLETRYSLIKKGNISMMVEYLYNRFSGNQYTSIAWDMLGGYRPGKNMNIRVMAIYYINEVLQLNADYNLRKSEGYQAVHTGTIQLRAFF